MHLSLRITLPVALPRGDCSLTYHVLQLCFLSFMFCLLLLITSRSVFTKLLVEILHFEAYVFMQYDPTFLFLLLSIICQHLISSNVYPNFLGDPSFYIDDHSSVQLLGSLISSPMIFFFSLPFLSHILHHKLDLVPPNSAPTTTFAYNHTALYTNLLSSLVNYFYLTILWLHVNLHISIFPFIPWFIILITLMSIP